MATGGLYGNSTTGAAIASPTAESNGLYGNSPSFGGTYFEWFIFQVSDTQPATPTGGSWSFQTNTGTPPTGWLATPPTAPTNIVWVSIALVNSKNGNSLTWSTPGMFSFASGLPILSGASAPTSGDGQSNQMYIETGTSPQSIWFKEYGTWTKLTGSTLYVDLTSDQTIAGTKTFTSQIQGSISGNASNVTGVVGVDHGGTGSTTASAARTALGAAASGANSDITSLSGLTTALSVSQGGTGATTASAARANLGAAASGANSDITSLSGITGGISTADYLQLDTAITPSVGVAKLQWDTTWGGPQIGMEGGNVNLQIGQETLIKVYNNTGSDLTDGQVVYVTGSQGQRLTVALAQANADSTSATIIGMVTEPIANNASGFVTTQGMVNGLNTSGAADGAVVYLSPTTAGAWTTTKPVAPQHMVMVGYIVKGGSAGAGSIYVNTQNGYELEELHNVLITSPTSGNTLIYDASVGVWKNANISAGSGVSVTNGASSITVGNTGVLSISGGTTGLTPSTATTGAVTLAGTLAVANGGTGVTTSTGSGSVVLSTSPTLVTPALGTPTSGNFSTGTFTWPTFNQNTTGNAATATTAINVSGGTASVTTLTTSSTVTLNGGTANGVGYLNGSKVLTTGSALQFDGTNLGLGVTPSAWSTLRGFDIGSNGSLSGHASGATDSAFVSGNAYFNGTNWIYKGTSTATQYKMYGGVHSWFTAPSGTAGNPITFTQAMTLDASGNLGVGTTSIASGGAGTLNVNFHSPSSTTTYFKLSNAVTGNTAADGFDLICGSDTWAYLWQRETSPMLFGTNNAERMRIDASGNVGIGLTPTSTYGRLQVLADGGSFAAGGNRAIEIYDAGGGAGEGGALTFSSASCPAFAAVYGVSANPGGALVFATNSANTGYPAERARIDSSGNLLVGTTNASGTAGVGFKAITSSAGIQAAQVTDQTTNAGGTAWNYYSTGAAAFRFYVGAGGTVFATSTSISAISDATLKENIRDLETGLTQVMALKPRRFDWKNGDAQNVAGFIAQELEEVLPELVYDYKYNETETKKSIKMGDILPTLVKAIQEQQAIIVSMREELDALKTKVGA